jgi:hypothetical protein
LYYYIAIHDSRDLFFAQAAYPKTTDTATSDIVQFTQVDFNYAQSFNGSVFQPKTDGYFFFHLSYGKQRNGSLNVDLKDANNVVLTQLQASRQSGKCLFSANHLVKLNHDQTVHVTSSTPVNYNNTDLLPTLVGFRFDNLTMKPFVAMQQEYHAIEPRWDIYYFFINLKHSDSTINSIAHNFNKSTTTNTRIRVPVSGIYVVSITSTAKHMFPPQNPEGSVSLGLRASTNFKSNLTIQLGLSFYADKLLGDNNLTTSLFYLLHINTTDYMTLTYIGMKGMTNVSSQVQLTLQLLLYSPAHGEQAAWAMRLSHSNQSAKINSCLIDVCINVNVSC